MNWCKECATKQKSFIFVFPCDLIIYSVSFRVVDARRSFFRFVLFCSVFIVYYYLYGVVWYCCNAANQFDESVLR